MAVAEEGTAEFAKHRRHADVLYQFQEAAFVPVAKGVFMCENIPVKGRADEVGTVSRSFTFKPTGHNLLASQVLERSNGLLAVKSKRLAFDKAGRGTEIELYAVVAI